MSSNSNENYITDYLFENLQSNNNSSTDIDDFFTFKITFHHTKVIENNSSDENEENNTLKEIVCLNYSNVLTSFSPKKHGIL